MIATIKPYDTGQNKAFMIVLSGDAGDVVEKIVVKAIIIEGEPWPCMVAGQGNDVMVTR